MKYPRVTEVLNPFTKYDTVPKQILDNAAHRGTQVHALCAGIARGFWLPEEMIQEQFRGYIESFNKWKQSQVKNFLVIEERYISEELGYTGQIDFVITGSDSEVYLADLKTSAKPQKTYPLQLAAYERLLKRHSISIKGAMLIYLNREGEFPNIDMYHDLTEEKQIFTAALDCWKYFHKRKRKRNDL